MLADEVHEGDRVLARWDEAQDRVVLNVELPEAASTQPEHDTAEAEPAATG